MLGSQSISRKQSISAASSYTVLGIGIAQPADNVQILLDKYYRHQFNQEEFRRLHNRISQRLKTLLAKLQQKADTFKRRLQQSDEAESYRLRGDLLMANLHQWRPGMSAIELSDFATGKPVVLPLNPEKNAVQNAQALYKQHQKLRRARTAVLPLLSAVEKEIHYLEQVEDSLRQVSAYQSEADLRSLEETQSELIVQGYLRDATGYQSGENTGKLSGRRSQQSGRRHWPIVWRARTCQLPPLHNASGPRSAHRSQQQPK